MSVKSHVSFRTCTPGLTQGTSIYFQIDLHSNIQLNLERMVLRERTPIQSRLKISSGCVKNQPASAGA